MYQANYLANLLRTASLGRDDALFASTPQGRSISYGEMFEAAERHATVLLSAGLNPGDRVAIQVEKSLEAIQLYLGTLLAGGVFLPLNTAYTTTELQYFLSDAEPAVMICDPDKSDELEPVLEAIGVSNLFTLSHEGTGTLSDAVAAQAADRTTAEFQAVARSEDDLAAILYTSGTTGRSKGAMLSHENLASNARTLKEYWHFSDKDVLIHALPIFHTHGLFVATNIALCAACSMIFMPRFDAEAVLEQMDKATVMMGVPTFYVRLLESTGLSRDTVSHMRLFVSGSAPLLSETHKRWQALTGHAILERYGMTETSMNSSNPYNGERRAGTVGLPLPGVEIRITDAQTGKTLPPGEMGGVEVRGANVFQGYWQMPEKTREEFRDDGFFITGDIGVIDDQGYLSIIGRSKDLIISGGYNVYPKEIEIVIDAIEGVTESAVIGLPHPDFGEGVAAVVVNEPGITLVEADLLTHLSDKLARYKQPKKIRFVQQLPRNPMGKVQKNILRDHYHALFREQD